MRCAAPASCSASTPPRWRWQRPRGRAGARPGRDLCRSQRRSAVAQGRRRGRRRGLGSAVCRRRADGPVPGNGARTPSLVSGSGAAGYAQALGGPASSDRGARTAGGRGGNAQAAAQRVHEGAGRDLARGAHRRRSRRTRAVDARGAGDGLRAGRPGTAARGCSREAGSTPRGACTRWRRRARCSMRSERPRG